jgi:hypothetical protein
MLEKSFSNYYLVGGTALALQIGHRNSVDIDLFGDQPIDHDLYFEILSNLGTFEVSKSSKNVFISLINNIKVDFVNYRYPLLDKPLEIEGIRMLSKKDIAAMKMNAISGRGSKKDFIDLFFILKDYSLATIMGFYTKKYNDGSAFLVLKSLIYFEDAEIEEMPFMFNNITWQTVKDSIKKAHASYMTQNELPSE